jgi:hypothetical protein
MGLKALKGIGDSKATKDSKASLVHREIKGIRAGKA